MLPRLGGQLAWREGGAINVEVDPLRKEGLAAFSLHSCLDRYLASFRY